MTCRNMPHLTTAIDSARNLRYMFTNALLFLAKSQPLMWLNPSTGILIFGGPHGVGPFVDFRTASTQRLSLTTAAQSVI